MNNIQRRLFRAFVNAGGDLSDDTQVERFIRFVEASLVLLPPRVRGATELVWRGIEAISYDGIAAQLSEREGVRVSTLAVRQRFSRGARFLEDAVRQRGWGDAPSEPTKPTSTVRAHWKPSPGSTLMRR